MFLKSFFGDVDNPHPCANCQRDGDALDFEVRMAFQPILDADTRTVYAYEALVRGANGEGAGDVIARVTPQLLYRFDQTCRVRAITTAAKLGMQARLSINFNPNAVYEPATCIRLTLAAAGQCGFPTDRLIFEVTESERVRDTAHLVRIFDDYHRRGFMTAIDDFGAGFGSFYYLKHLPFDYLKIDGSFIRDLDGDPMNRSIVDVITEIGHQRGLDVVAEWVGSESVIATLRELGVDYAQGFALHRPEPVLYQRLADKTGAS